MNSPGQFALNPQVRIGNAWRKSRIAARILHQNETRKLSPQRAVLATLLAKDPEVSNRLIQHGLDWLAGRKAQASRIARELEGERT